MDAPVETIQTLKLALWVVGGALLVVITAVGALSSVVFRNLNAAIVEVRKLTTESVKDLVSVRETIKMMVERVDGNTQRITKLEDVDEKIRQRIHDISNVVNAMTGQIELMRDFTKDLLKSMSDFFQSQRRPA